MLRSECLKWLMREIRMLKMVDDEMRMLKMVYDIRMLRMGDDQNA